MARTPNGKASTAPKAKLPSMHTTYPVPHTRQPPVDAHPRKGRAFLHLASAGVMIAGFQAMQDIAVGKAMAPQYGGFLQYLTIIGLLATVVFMIMSASQDMLPAVNVFKPIRRLLLLFALPIEVVISTIYWAIVLTKPDLMFPPMPAGGGEPSSSEEAGLLFRIPLWMDLSMHLLPAVALVIHFFTLEKRYNPPESTIGATALASSFGAAYAFWVEHCAKINGRFPYPFLNIMGGEERLVFYVFAVMLALGAFHLLNLLHR